MFVHAVVAWLLLAGLSLSVLLALALGHYAFMRIGQRNRRTVRRRRRPRIFLVAAGFAFLHFMSELYCPGAKFLLAEKCDEDADEDGSGDPDSIDKQLSRQLKRIRRGEKIGDLVLRL